MTPFRVMHLVWGFELGGAERFVLDFVRRIDRSRYESAICAFAEDGPLRLQMAATGVPIFGIRRTSVPVTLLQFLSIVKEFQPDIIHAHSLGPGFYGACAKAIMRVPVLTTRHGRPEESARPSVARFISNRFTDRFIAVSDEVRLLLVRQSHIASRKIFTVVNGTDITRFSPPIKLDRRFLLGLPDANFVFGTVGRLDHTKAQHLMLRGLRILLNRGGDAHLVIVGEGPLREELQDVITDLHLEDRVKLLGARSDIPQLLRAFDAFLLSSTDEGVPLSLLEAMASERPVIATHVGGIPEVITDNFDGLLVQPGNAPVLAAAMERLVSDSATREQLGRSAFETVQTRFSIERMLADYYLHYDDLYYKKRSSQVVTLPLPAPGKIARLVSSTLSVCADEPIEHPVLVLESDDWGQSATHNAAVYRELLNSNVVTRENIWATDALETPEDVERLRDLCVGNPDAEGRPFVLTANFITSNPDFEAVERSSGHELPFIPLGNDHPNNPVSHALRKVWLATIANGTLCPEYHGCRHMSTESLLRLWRAKNNAVRQYVRLRTRPANLTNETAALLLSEYIRADIATGTLWARPREEQEQLVRSGVNDFMAVFSKSPNATIAPHYLWNNATEQAWSAVGIETVQAVNRHPAMRRRLGFVKTGRFHLGGIGPTGLTYLTRNCRFEPALFGDTAESVFHQIQVAFKTRRPAILGCHRINFSGSLFPERRDATLSELGRLLDKVRNRYPSVVFLSSGELGRLLRHRTDDSPTRTGVFLPRVWHMARRFILRKDLSS